MLLHHYKYKNKLDCIKLSQKYDQKSFFLNNSKLKKRLGINIYIKDLKKECISLSKRLFLYNVSK